MQEKRELYPPDPIFAPPVNWVRVGFILIFLILSITVLKRSYGLSEDIEKIDGEIEKEAHGCLQKFSNMNCPFDDLDSSEACRKLYNCARQTKSTDHIKAFLEKAAYMAVFEVTTEAVGPILIVAIIIALKIVQKFDR